MSTQPPTASTPDLLPLCEAVRLIPGRGHGRAIHVATLRRWIARGWVPGYWVGGMLKVSAGELAGVIRQREPTRPSGRKGRPGLTRAQEARRTAETLRRHGMLPPGG